MSQGAKTVGGPTALALCSLRRALRWQRNIRLALGRPQGVASTWQVDQAIVRAKYRLKEGQDALDMPDMSNCIIA